jgi:hypothetical protein
MKYYATTTPQRLDAELLAEMYALPGRTEITMLSVVVYLKFST